MRPRKLRIVKPGNPFVPSVSLVVVSQPSRRKRVKIIVFTLLGIQASLLLALLIHDDGPEVVVRGRSVGVASALRVSQNDQSPGAEHRRFANLAVASNAPANLSSDHPGPAQSEMLYSVKSGDTLSQIAQAYGTSVRTIKAANHLNSEHLAVGNKLIIPNVKLMAVTASKPGNPQ